MTRTINTRFSFAVVFQMHFGRTETHIVSIMPRNPRDCGTPAATDSLALQAKLATKSRLRQLAGKMYCAARNLRSNSVRLSVYLPFEFIQTNRLFRLSFQLLYRHSRFLSGRTTTYCKFATRSSEIASLNSARLNVADAYYKIHIMRPRFR